MPRKISVDTLFQIRQKVSLDEANFIEMELCHRAFDLVRDFNDWRGPIDAELRMAEVPYSVDFIAHAIGFITATNAKITHSVNGEYTRFQAAGYRNGPAGP